MVDVVEAITPVPAPVPVVEATAPAAPVIVTVPAPTATPPTIQDVSARMDSLEAFLRAKLGDEVKVVETAVVGKPCAAVRAWLVTKNAGIATWTFAGCAGKALNGLKTLIFFGVTAALGLASELNAIDLTPVLSYVLPEGTMVSTAQAITMLSIAGIMLRLISKTPAFTRWTGQKFVTSGTGLTSGVDDPDVTK